MTQTSFWNKAKVPPTTRYQGSKLKLLSWIWNNIKHLEFYSALDAFGGTGSVSYLLKSHGKSATYNDYLKFNQIIGTAIIENRSVKLTAEDIDIILHKDHSVIYDNFVFRTFHDVYYTDEENAWLDIVAQNIPKITDKYKKAIAYFALYQACIVKRPYNLFHRKNLYMRTQDVERSFGNKTTWDTPFADHFKFFVDEANSTVFDSGVECRSMSYDALDVPGDYDLVYIDTPYLNSGGVGVDYFDFYHFLEGITDYSNWNDRIDRKKKHLPLLGTRSKWSDKRTITSAFDQLFAKYRNSILVVSYRSDGIPSEQQLIELLSEYKQNIRSIHYGGYKYALSTNNTSKEILIIAT